MELNRKGRRHKPNYLVRYKPNGEQIVCYHTENEWCQNCINFGEEVEVKLDNGEISKGIIITNYQNNN